MTPEKNFRTFFETMDDLIFISNHQGKIFYVNNAATKKLGYTFEELKDMNILDVHPVNKRKEAEQIFNDMLAGKRDSCPLPLARKNGTYIPVETRVWFGTWDGKDCIFGISKDLSTEQEALQKFNRLSENNPAPMAVSTIPDRIFTEVNEAFIKTTGYSKVEIIGKTSEKLGLFPQFKEQQKNADELQRDGRVQNYKLKVKTKNGDILDGLFSGEIIESQEKKYFLTVMVDITERKQAEERFQYEADDRRILLENIKTQIWYLTNEYTYGAVNESHAAFNGVKKEDLAFKNMYDIFPKELVEVCKKSNISVFQGKQVYTEEWVPHFSGEQRLITITKTPVFNTDGSVEYAACSAEDITRDTLKRKKSERALRESEKEKLIILGVAPNKKVKGIGQEVDVVCF